MRPPGTANCFRLATAAALVLLASCGPKGAANSTPTAAAPPAAAGASAAPAAGAGTVIDFSQIPHPSAGLWKTVVDDGDGQPMTMTECYSGQMPAMKVPKNCAKLSFTRDASGAVVVDMDCGDDRMRMAEHIVGTGDYQTQMVSDGEMTVTMAGQPPRVSKIHTVSTRVGACPPGAKLDTPDVAD